MLCLMKTPDTAEKTRITKVLIRIYDWTNNWNFLIRDFFIFNLDDS